MTAICGRPQNGDRLSGNSINLKGLLHMEPMIGIRDRISTLYGSRIIEVFDEYEFEERGADCFGIPRRKCLTVENVFVEMVYEYLAYYDHEFRIYLSFRRAAFLGLKQFRRASEALGVRLDDCQRLKSIFEEIFCEFNLLEADAVRFETQKMMNDDMKWPEHLSAGQEAAVGTSSSATVFDDCALDAACELLEYTKEGVRRHRMILKENFRIITRHREHVKSGAIDVERYPKLQEMLDELDYCMTSLTPSDCDEMPCEEWSIDLAYPGCDDTVLDIPVTADEFFVEDVEDRS